MRKKQRFLFLIFCLRDISCSMNPGEKLMIGQHMRQWRALRGMKQREVAQKMGVSEAAISYIENDLANVNLRQLEKLSAILGISVVMLLEGPNKFLTGPAA